MAHQLDSKSCKNPICPNGGVIPTHPGHGVSAFCSDECRDNYPEDLRKAEQNSRQYLSRRQVLQEVTATSAIVLTSLLEAESRTRRYERAWQELQQARRDLIELRRPFPKVAEKAKQVGYAVQLLVQLEKRKGLEAAYLWNAADQLIMEGGEQGDDTQSFRVLSKRAAGIKYFWHGQRNPIEYAKALLVYTSLHYGYAETCSGRKMRQHHRYAMEATNEAIEVLEGVCQHQYSREVYMEVYELLFFAGIWKFKLYAFALDNAQEAEAQMHHFEELAHYNTESPWVWLNLRSQTAGYVRKFEGAVEDAQSLLEAAYTQYHELPVKSPALEMTPLRAEIEILSDKNDPRLEASVRRYADFVCVCSGIFEVKTVAEFKRRFGITDLPLPEYIYTYKTPMIVWQVMGDLF